MLFRSTRSVDCSLIDRARQPSFCGILILLGHCAFDIVTLLQTNGLIHFSTDVFKNSVCPSCQLARATKLPFQNNTTICDSPFDIIHCDLWGPAPVVSDVNYKYYVSFAFLHFVKLVDAQFSTKIKCFQSDGGGEFMSSKLQDYLSHNGILYYVSCPYTPAQNGLVERRHRSIMETGLTLLFHSKVPAKFWTYSSQTAAKLLNRRPISSLPNGMSPFFALFGKHADYSSPRVFGNCCFPCICAYNSHKFQPRSV